MKSSKMTKIGIIFIFLSVVLTADVWAAKSSEHMGSDLLVDVAVKHLEKGQKKEAIHELSKALMLDPNNETARKHLFDLGLQEGLYDSGKTSADHIAHLSESLLAYRQMVERLEQQRSQLHQKFTHLQQEVRDLRRSETVKSQAMDLLNERITELHHMVEEQPKDQKMVESQSAESMLEESTELEPNQPVMQPEMTEVELEEALEFESLAKVDIDAYEDQSSQLRQLERELKTTRKYSQEMVEQYNLTMNTMQSYMQNKYDIQNKFINVLEDFHNQREDQLSQQADAITLQEIELTKQGIVLHQNAEVIEEQREALDDFNEKLYDEQYLIDNKSRLVKELVKDMEEIKQEVYEKDTIIARQKEDIALLNSDLTQAEHKISYLLKKHDAFVDSLRENIELAQ